MEKKNLRIKGKRWIAMLLGISIIVQILHGQVFSLYAENAAAEKQLSVSGNDTEYVEDVVGDNVAEYPEDTVSGNVPKYTLTLQVTGMDNGEISVKRNGSPVRQAIQEGNNVLEISAGERVEITTAAKAGCNIESAEPAALRTSETNGSYTIESVSQNVSCRVKFAENIIKVEYTGSGCTMQPSDGTSKNGVVTINAGNNGFSVTPKSNTEYYPIVTGNTVVETAFCEYAFQGFGTAEVRFDKDNISPVVSVSGNSTGELYTNHDMDIYLDITERESGIRNVKYKIDEGYERDASLKDGRYYFGITDDNVILNSFGSLITFTVADNVGNEGHTQLRVFYDTEPPRINEAVLDKSVKTFVQNGRQFVNREITVKVNASDDFGFLNNLKYYISPVEMTAEELTEVLGDFTVVNVSDTISGGEYLVRLDAGKVLSGKNYVYFTAEDKAGNVQKETYGLCEFVVDDVAPVVKELTDVSAQDGVWKKKTASISMNGVLEDEQTPGGLSYFYKVEAADRPQPNVTGDEDGWIRIGDSGCDETQYTFLQGIENGLGDGSYKVWVWAKDGCQNISTPASYLFHIDSTSPETGNLRFVVTENGKQSDRIFWRQFGNFFNKRKLAGKTEEVLLKVDASDLAQGSYTGDVPDIKDIRLFYVTADEFETEDAYLETIAETDSMPNLRYKEVPVSRQDGAFTFSFQVPANTVFYRLMLVVCDKAGNYSYTTPKICGFESNLVMVDPKEPQISLAIDGKFATADYVQTVDGNKVEWYRGEKDVSCQISVTDKDSGLALSEININGKDIRSDNFLKISPRQMIQSKAYVVNASDGTMAPDGHYRFEVEAEDNAGNTAKMSKSISIDRDAPVIVKAKFSKGGEDSMKQLPKQYAFYFKGATKLTISATDFIGNSNFEGSGVKSFTFYMAQKDGKKTEEVTIQAVKEKAGTYTATFPIPKAFKGQVYIKATDRVGQSSAYVHPKGIVIESESEHKKCSKTKIILPQTQYKDAQGLPLYSTAPHIRFETSDTKSGIAKEVWSVKTYKGDEAEGSGTLNISAKYNQKTNKWEAVLEGDKKWTVSSKLDLNLVQKAGRNYRVQSEENHITASLKMTDNVGNSEKTEKESFSVDTSAPVITVEYDNNEVYHEKYYNQERNATVTVKDANFSEEDAEFIITGPDVAISPWEHVAQGGCDGKVHTKECLWKCNVNFSEDGDYTFAFKCRDLAGWEAEYESVDEFTIDRTNPVITVQYDNNDARNGYYYKEKRVATIQIEEKNFEPADVEITMTASEAGKSIALPAINGWSEGNDMHSATISYDYDGEFTFQIAYTDLANNEAEAYEKEQFVVDMTEPLLEVVGVENKSANNQEVKPIIRVEDTNLDPSQIVYTLIGVNHGVTKCEAKRTLSGKTVQYMLEDLPYEQQMDDLYTLQAKALDQAGNEVETQITYSVNRFGSVYVPDEKTRKLRENLYLDQEIELFLSEINVDSLVKKEVTYSKDGEIVVLEEGKDYEVEEAGDESTWKQYDYRIFPDNFKEEGRYTVMLYSRDRAGNASDNKVKDEEIEFVIDKTAPSMLIAGVEQKGQYNADTKAVTINVEDNVGLSVVEIYYNRKKTAEYTADELEGLNGNLTVNLEKSNQWQELQVVTRDAAGNQTDSGLIRFLLTKNIFVQWYRNTWAFYGSIVVILLLITGMAVFGARRKREKSLCG